MSYSVTFYIIPKGCTNIEHDIEWRSVTYNLRDMFVALPCGYIKDWNKKSTNWIYKKAIDSIKELRTKPLNYRQYEAENGWGAVDGMIDFLEWVVDNILKYPYAKIKVG